MIRGEELMRREGFLNLWGVALAAHHPYMAGARRWCLERYGESEFRNSVFRPLIRKVPLRRLLYGEFVKTGGQKLNS